MSRRCSPAPTARAPPSPLPLLILLGLALPRIAAPLSTGVDFGPTRPHYNYFACGSNMCSATMTALRSFRPVASTAAVLPDHHLRFNVPGMPGVEPSFASVEPTVEWAEADMVGTRGGDHVHGVLYLLTEEDFGRVLLTECVPLAYTVHRCRPFPYVGDGADAGVRALEEGERGANGEGGRRRGGVPAYTLRAARPEWRGGPDVPPSRSYLNIILRGSREYNFDAEYVAYLERVETMSRGLAFPMMKGVGVAEAALDLAEKARAWQGGQ